MSIILQWIELDGDSWESAEGRFIIFRHIDGFYVQDRPPTERKGQSWICGTVEGCKEWAHRRLEEYWQVEANL